MLARLRHRLTWSRGRALYRMADYVGWYWVRSRRGHLNPARGMEHGIYVPQDPVVRDPQERLLAVG